MPTETSSLSQTTATTHKASFFRQSGWMMITAVAGGALMFAVVIISKNWLSDAEYSAFAVLVQLTNWMNIPALGLQMVFAQQTAQARTDLQRSQLVGTVKSVMLWTFCLWLAMALVMIGFQNQCIAALKLSNAASLWLTLMTGLVMLWLPICQGLMQGRQNFLWLGWVAILNGLGRITIGALFVLVIHWQATGLMVGVLIGMAISFVAGARQNFDLWKWPRADFDASAWLKRVIPLTLGFGASTFIFSADAIVVQNYFGHGNTANYLFGGTLCRAIVLFTAPLAAVMFPKLVHSRASAQKTDLMGLTLLGTGAMGLCALLGLWLVGPIIFKHQLDSFAPLVPLFAFGMVLLGMGNVLMNNLMAHSRFKVVPVWVVLAISYWITLQHFHDSFKTVILTFDFFAGAFLAIGALFNWVIDKEQPGDFVQPSP